MRLRQAVLVSEDLEHIVDQLQAIFEIEVSFRDPGVKYFGLQNAVMPVGDQFIEVVSPITLEAPARRYLERRQGESGYMLMFETQDFAGDRARCEALGMRVVWSAELPDIAGMHLHPADTGGPLISIDQPKPAGAWRWAGPDWQAHVRRETARGLAGAVIEAKDPAAVAARWAEVLDRPLRDGAIALEGGRLDFVPAGARGDGLVGFRVAVAEPAAVLARAKQRGLSVLAGDEPGFELCGAQLLLA